MDSTSLQVYLVNVIYNNNNLITMELTKYTYGLILCFGMLISALIFSVLNNLIFTAVWSGGFAGVVFCLIFKSNHSCNSKN